MESSLHVEAYVGKPYVVDLPHVQGLSPGTLDEGLQTGIANFLIDGDILNGMNSSEALADGNLVVPGDVMHMGKSCSLLGLGITREGWEVPPGVSHTRHLFFKDNDLIGREDPVMHSAGEQVKLIHFGCSSRTLVLVTEDVQPLSEDLDLVLEKIGEVERVVGLSFEGLEETWALFAKLECRRNLGDGGEALPGAVYRELQNLEGGLSFNRENEALASGRGGCQLGIHDGF